jgi:hypothetical protein
MSSITSHVKVFTKNVLGDSFVHALKIGAKRFIGGQNDHLLLYRDMCVREYSVPNCETFFGYYDLTEADEGLDKLLSLAVPEDGMARVGYFSRESGKFHQISETAAWNWQMGSRLRWYDDQHVMFNDYDGAKFVTRVCSLDSTEVRRWPRALYDMDFSAHAGYYTDFSVLGVLRPGYGYANIPVKMKDYQPDNNGLFKLDTENGECSLLVSVSKLMDIAPNPSMNGMYHYINHISVNEITHDIMFFHIWTDLHKWQCRMIVCTDNGGIKTVIDDFDMISHYAWKNQDEILATVFSGGKCEYRLYNIHTCRHRHICPELIFDGHPTYIRDDIFITDSYPDKYSMQHIFLCGENSGAEKLISLYHQPGRLGEFRCDLHPRYKEGIVAFDTNMYGKRRQIVFPVDA